MIRKKQSLSNLFQYYMDIRMIRILLLGAISGFPWVLIGSSLSLWLKEEGLSRSTIGWAGLIFGVYAFNYLWAPLIDRIQIPYLTKKNWTQTWMDCFNANCNLSIFSFMEFNKSYRQFGITYINRLSKRLLLQLKMSVDALGIEQIGEKELNLWQQVLLWL